MKGRERALRALKREPVDRTPIYSHFRNPAAIEKISGMDFKSDPFAATAAAYRILEIDMTKEISVPFTEAPPGYMVNATGYGINRVEPETSDLEEFVKVAGQLADYDQLKAEFDFDNEIRKIRSWFDRQQNAVGDSTLITGQTGGCFDCNLERFGYVVFLSAIMLEPDAAEAAIRYHAAMRRLHAEAFVKAGCSNVIMYCDDIAGTTGLMVPPDIMRELWLPHVKWIIEPLLEAGIFVTYHSDGDIRSILDNISESGFSGLHPLEPRAGMDPVEIKPEWGDRFILFGGLCPVSVLPYGTEGEVREEVRRLLDGAAEDGGYFIGSAGMTGPEIPAENALGWIGEAKEHGRRFGQL